MSNHIQAAIEELKLRRAHLDQTITMLEAAARAFGSPVATPATAAPVEKVKRKYKKRVKAAEPVSRFEVPVTSAPPQEPSPGETPNIDLTPLSAGGIAIGKTLSGPFTATDLQARLDGPKGRAYTWIAAWKRKDWLNTVGFNAYSRKENFGE